MIARLQRAITSAVLLLVLGWAVFFLLRGEPGHAGWAALVVAGGYASFLAAEFVLAALSHEDGGPGRAGLAQLLQAWAVEVLTAPIVFCWRQPFRSRAIPDSVGASAAASRPVLLVHGFLCNRGFWNPWMKRLHAQGIRFVAPTLEPAFGSIDLYVDQIEREVQRLHAASGHPVVIVAHSMGGLAVRAWLRRHPSSDARVWRVFTIASPHRGTAIARHAPSTNGQQMRVGSRWLRALADAEPPDRLAKFTCYFGNCDNIAFPALRAMLPGARNQHVPATAHVHMASLPEIFDEVVRATRVD